MNQETVTARTKLDPQIGREVLQIRYWQHVLNEALKEKAFKIPVHTAFGHEAIAVAVSRMMQDHDQLVCTHRNLEYNLARAGSLAPIWKEFKAEPGALAGGHLGSMNLANPERGLVYSSSILGNNLSVACGLALANQTRERDAVVVCLTGDGGMEEGAFWEALVFAESRKLRLIFIVENNNMSMSSTIPERRCPIDISKVCAAVGVPFEPLAGNDVYLYLATLDQLRGVTAERPGPVCIEVSLKALSQHAGPTPGWPTDPKNISLADGLLVEPTGHDPLHVLQQTFGKAWFDETCADVVRRGPGV